MEKKNPISLLNDMSFLKELPSDLFMEVFDFVTMGLKEKISFFSNKPTKFIRRIFSCFETYFFEQGERIYEVGEAPIYVYFLMNGRVLGICNHKDCRIHLKVAGSFFGEVDILLKRARVETAFAETFVEVCKLSKEDFIEILEDFKEIKKEIEVTLKLKQKFHFCEGLIEYEYKFQGRKPRKEKLFIKIKGNTIIENFDEFVKKKKSEKKLIKFINKKFAINNKNHSLEDKIWKIGIQLEENEKNEEEINKFLDEMEIKSERILFILKNYSKQIQKIIGKYKK